MGSMQATMTGEVDFAIGFGATALAVVRTGKVRVLTVIEGKPFGWMPENACHGRYHFRVRTTLAIRLRSSRRY
jgi:hypothetical protein